MDKLQSSWRAAIGGPGRPWLAVFGAIGLVVGLVIGQIAGTGLDVNLSTSAGSGAKQLARQSERPVIRATNVQLQLAFGELVLGVGRGSVVISGEGATTNFTCTGTGSNTGTDGLCRRSFFGAQRITLEARPTDEPFQGWLGDCSGTANCVLEMSNKQRHAFAVFGSASKYPQRSLQVLMVRKTKGGSVKLDGADLRDVNTQSPCGEGAGGEPEVVLCRATLPALGHGLLTATAGAEQLFAGWIDLNNYFGDCFFSSTPTCAVNPPNDGFVIVLFDGPANAWSTLVLKQSWDVDAPKGTDLSDAVVTGPNGVRCSTSASLSGVCTRSMRNGTAITLTAQSGVHGLFQGWDGDCTGTQPTCTFNLATDRAVVAKYKYR